MNPAGPTSDTAALAEGLRVRDGGLAADLGAGSGGVARFVADGSVRWLMLDVNPELLALCEIPGAMRVCCDVARATSALPAGIASVVTANPPYLAAGSARRPVCRAREQARIAGPLALPLFYRAASHLLEEGGEFRTIGRPRSLEEMLVTCSAFDMGPFEIQPFGPQGRPASLVRIRALLGARAALEILPQKPLPGSGRIEAGGCARV
ncbi:MAG: hypothetical protein IT351_04215 [Candidatus Fermentibacter sp.]|nr:hypothetical protein [Candidatus Fermentibacter sp.]